MRVPWRDEKIRRIAERPEIRASAEVILSVFLVVFLLFIAIRPTLAIVATLQKKIDDQDVVDKKLSNKLAQLVKAQNDLSTYGDKLPLFSEAVPDETARADLVRRVQVLAGEDNLTINNISLDAVPVLGSSISLSDKSVAATKIITEPGTSVASYALTFDVNGSQDQLVAFLRDLQNMDRLARVINIDFKKESQKGTETTTAGLRLTGKALVYYVLKQK